MKGSVLIDFGGWQTPNFVRASFPPAEDGKTDYKPLPLSAVPDETFHRLIEEWVREMYEKAGKRRPPTALAA